MNDQIPSPGVNAVTGRAVWEKPLGLADKDQLEYTTLRDNPVTPCKEIARILRGKPKAVRQESQ